MRLRSLNHTSGIGLLLAMLLTAVDQSQAKNLIEAGKRHIAAED
jgi:hypothetical protein